MKTLLRAIIINSFSLFLLSQLLDGVKIRGGVLTFIFGGIILSLMSMLLRPILNLIALPLNVVTLGTFSAFINAIILYLLTIFVSDISVSAFTFEGFRYGGFVIPKIYFNTLLAFIVSSVLLSLIISVINWLRS